MCCSNTFILNNPDKTNTFGESVSLLTTKLFVFYKVFTSYYSVLECIWLNIYLSQELKLNNIKLWNTRVSWKTLSHLVKFVAQYWHLYISGKNHQAWTFAGLKSSLTYKAAQGLTPRKFFHLLGDNWHHFSIFWLITVDSLFDIMAACLFENSFYINNDSTKTTFTWISKEMSLLELVIQTQHILEVLVQKSRVRFSISLHTKQSLFLLLHIYLTVFHLS